MRWFQGSEGFAKSNGGFRGNGRCLGENDAISLKYIRLLLFVLDLL